MQYKHHMRLYFYQIWCSPYFFITFDGSIITLDSTNIILDRTFLTLGGTFVRFEVWWYTTPLTSQLIRQKVGGFSFDVGFKPKSVTSKLLAELRQKISTIPIKLLIEFLVTGSLSLYFKAKFVNNNPFLNKQLHIFSSVDKKIL